MTPDGKPETRVLVAVAAQGSIEAMVLAEAVEFTYRISNAPVPITRGGEVVGWARSPEIGGEEATMLVTWTPPQEPTLETRPAGAGRREARSALPWLCPVLESPAMPHNPLAEGEVSRDAMRRWEANGGPMARLTELIVGHPMPDVAARLAWNREVKLNALNDEIDIAVEAGARDETLAPLLERRRELEADLREAETGERDAGDSFGDSPFDREPHG